MRISKKDLLRIVREEKARLAEASVSGSGPYSGPRDIVDELNMLEKVLYDLQAAGRNLPAPMDTRIMEATEHLQQALDILYGEA